MMGLIRRFYHRLLSVLYNVQPVDEGIYRSAQMYGPHVGALLDHYGFRTVVNLRGANPGVWWYETEKRACEERGARLIDVPFNSKRLPRREKLQELLTVFESAPRPILIKCSGGADRTSFVSGFYLLDRLLRTEADVRATADAAVKVGVRQTRRFPYLHFPKQYQRWIRAFFRFYADAHQGLAPREWVSQAYSRDAFADYLTRNGMGGFWKSH